MTINSSVISAVTYSVEASEMTITFNSGARYRYYGVEFDEYQALINAESVGLFFNAVFRDLFDFTRLA